MLVFSELVYLYQFNQYCESSYSPARAPSGLSCDKRSRPWHRLAQNSLALPCLPLLWPQLKYVTRPYCLITADRRRMDQPTTETHLGQFNNPPVNRVNQVNPAPPAPQVPAAPADVKYIKPPQPLIEPPDGRCIFDISGKANSCQVGATNTTKTVCPCGIGLQGLMSVLTPSFAMSVETSPRSQSPLCVRTWSISTKTQRHIGASSRGHGVRRKLH